MFEILEHTLKDTLPMLPLLFLTYLLLEYLEHKDSFRLRRMLSLQRFAPICAAFLGIIPQCGFSLVAVGLYADHLISLGTLLAVFISTSDEAIPILLAHPEHMDLLIAVIVLKWMIAIFMAYVVDAIYPRIFAHVPSAPAQAEPSCNLKKEEQVHSLWREALYRTLKIFSYVLVVTFIINILIHTFGETRLEFILFHQTPFQPFLAALIGLIPNCASSVLLAQLFISGTLSFGSLLGGLISNAGLSLMVLYRSVPKKTEAVRISVLLFLIAWCSGTIMQLWM